MTDTVRGTIAATDQQMRKLASLIDFLSDCESRVVKARDLASFIGMVSSLFSFVGHAHHVYIIIPCVKLQAIVGFQCPAH